MGKRRVVSREKAREILRHGEVRGKRLSKRARGFFGMRAAGRPLRRVRDGGKA